MCFAWLDREMCILDVPIALHGNKKMIVGICTANLVVTLLLADLEHISHGLAARKCLLIRFFLINILTIIIKIAKW